jgi:pyruvate dehydrogenase E1 component beta subunit
MFQAIRSDNPVIFFEHVLLYNVKGVPKGKDHVQCLEKAELVREGTDCVIFTYSRMRYVVMQVCVCVCVCV